MCIPATSALQDTFCQTMIIQERKTEGDSSGAKYSVLPVCFFLFFIFLSSSASSSSSSAFTLHSHPLSTCLLMRLAV